MIESFEVHNFQSWKHAKVNLSPGVNVFVGESDHGKSALAIRSLLWVINNTPEHQLEGSSNIRSWWVTAKDETSVSIKVSDSPDVIKRVKRGTGHNYYQIGNQQRLDKPGAKVPDAVARLLNIQPVNIHEQGDGFFFIGMSDPDKARFLNELVNLDTMAETQSNIQKTLNTEKAEKKTAEAVLLAKTASLGDYDWIEAADSQLKELEATGQQITANKAKQAGLQKAIANIGNIQQQIGATARYPGVADELATLVGIQDRLALNRLKLSQLQQAIKSIEDGQSLLTKYKAITKYKSRIEELTIIQVRYNADIARETTMDNALKAIALLQTKVTTAKATATTLRVDYEAAMPEICPLCESEVTK